MELNEAFAPQVLAVLKDLPIRADRLNVNGGAIALGHPIGCTGARIVVTLLHELERRGASRGLATLCVSGGMGMAMAIESDCAMSGVIPGDGIGVDVTAEAVKDLAAVGDVFGRRFDLEDAAVERGSLSLKTGDHDCRPTATRCCATSSTRSSSARSAIRACPTTGTRATSCSARGSSSTSTSTTGPSSCSTSVCVR